MASYAPMPYSPYSPPMPYADTPQSYAAQPAPIPLTPLVVAGDDPSAVGGGGGGGMVTKFLALPPLILFPILLPVVVAVVAVVAAVVAAVVVAAKNPNAGVGSGGKENYDNNTAYYDDNNYGNDNQDNYNNNRPNKPSNRYRRQAENSSALPSMSIAQVDRLTQVVFAAMNSQECVQRLLCEVGSLSRSFSGSSETVTKAAKDYVPEKLKESFNIFAKAEKCEQYQCGSLKVKN